jgi:hypothetical protein
MRRGMVVSGNQLEHHHFFIQIPDSMVYPRQLLVCVCERERWGKESECARDREREREREMEMEGAIVNGLKIEWLEWAAVSDNNTSVGENGEEQKSERELR